MTTQHIPAGIDAAQAREAMEYARTWRTTAANVTKQRDDLLAALRALVREVSPLMEQYSARDRAALDAARAVITKATQVQS